MAITKHCEIGVISGKRCEDASHSTALRAKSKDAHSILRELWECAQPARLCAGVLASLFLGRYSFVIL